MFAVACAPPAAPCLVGIMLCIVHVQWEANPAVCVCVCVREENLSELTVKCSTAVVGGVPKGEKTKN